MRGGGGDLAISSAIMRTQSTSYTCRSEYGGLRSARPLGDDASEPRKNSTYRDKKETNFGDQQI